MVSRTQMVKMAQFMPKQTLVLESLGNALEKAQMWPVRNDLEATWENKWKKGLCSPQGGMLISASSVSAIST